MPALTNDRFMLGDLLQEYDAIGKRIDAYTAQIDERCCTEFCV